MRHGENNYLNIFGEKQNNMFRNIKTDIRRYTNLKKDGLRFKVLFYLIFTQGVWAIVIYRFGLWCSKLKIPIFSFFLRLIYFFSNKIVEIITGISISSSAQIEKGLYIGHFGGIFINEGVEIGENCTIAQGVTIGTLGLGKLGAPKIDDNVFIGSGAKVLGNIIIGKNVRIGANAVVIKDVPDNVTVVGIPAKIVKAGND